jgi:menaquinone-dependent protoporphyrinogen oxidase
MKVLVVYATRHGATRGIAERVAKVLEREGLSVRLADAEDPVAASGYDAFVVGGAAYMGHWLKPATEFVHDHETVLARRPTWLFSSGPVGTELVDKKGQDVVRASIPKEFADLETRIHPRAEQVFFGAFDPDQRPIGIGERLGAMFFRFGAIHDALPAGDFRDWPQIESWASNIAKDLKQGAAAITH